MSRSEEGKWTLFEKDSLSFTCHSPTEQSDSDWNELLRSSNDVFTECSLFRHHWSIFTLTELGEEWLVHSFRSQLPFRKPLIRIFPFTDRLIFSPHPSVLFFVFVHPIPFTPSRRRRGHWFIDIPLNNDKSQRHWNDHLHQRLRAMHIDQWHFDSNRWYDDLLHRARLDLSQYSRLHTQRTPLVRQTFVLFFIAAIFKEYLSRKSCCSYLFILTIIDLTHLTTMIVGHLQYSFHIDLIIIHSILCKSLIVLIYLSNHLSNWIVTLALDVRSEVSYHHWVLSINMLNQDVFLSHKHSFNHYRDWWWRQRIFFTYLFIQSARIPCAFWQFLIARWKTAVDDRSRLHSWMIQVRWLFHLVHRRSCSELHLRNRQCVANSMIFR